MPRITIWQDARIHGVPPCTPPRGEYSCNCAVLRNCHVSHPWLPPFRRRYRAIALSCAIVMSAIRGFHLSGGATVQLRCPAQLSCQPSVASTFQAALPCNCAVLRNCGRTGYARQGEAKAPSKKRFSLLPVKSDARCTRHFTTKAQSHEACEVGRTKLIC